MFKIKPTKLRRCFLSPSPATRRTTTDDDVEGGELIVRCVNFPPLPSKRTPFFLCHGAGDDPHGAPRRRHPPPPHRPLLLQLLLPLLLLPLLALGFRALARKLVEQSHLEDTGFLRQGGGVALEDVGPAVQPEEPQPAPQRRRRMADEICGAVPVRPHELRPQLRRWAGGGEPRRGLAVRLPRLLRPLRRPDVGLVVITAEVARPFSSILYAGATNS